jgi:hypothetical protein
LNLLSECRKIISLLSVKTFLKVLPETDLGQRVQEFDMTTSGLALSLLVLIVTGVAHADRPYNKHHLQCKGKVKVAKREDKYIVNAELKFKNDSYNDNSYVDFRNEDKFEHKALEHRKLNVKYGDRYTSPGFKLSRHSELGEMEGIVAGEETLFTSVPDSENRTYLLTAVNPENTKEAFFKIKSRPNTRVEISNGGRTWFFQAIIDKDGFSDDDEFQCTLDLEPGQ